jgi:hypothetical protein
MAMDVATSADDLRVHDGIMYYFMRGQRSQHAGSQRDFIRILVVQ